MAARRIAVPREARGERLDRFLAKALSGVTPDRVRVLLDGGHVRIGGKQAQPARKLWGGEEIEVASPTPRPAPSSPGGPPIPVLYRDDDVIIVNKPPGLVVEPEGTQPSVVGLLGARLSGFDVGGVAQPGVVHRLDRDTSGCLMLACNDESVARLKGDFEARRVEKRYWALVLGEPPQRGEMDTPYGRDPSDPRRFTTRFPSARRARLSFERREQLRDVAWLDVKLDTGRTHQIRVQLAEAGFPVLADAVYGTSEARSHPAAVALGRQALHSHRLAVAREVPISVAAELPEDMARALKLLGRDPTR